MRVVVQEETTGCALACIAALSERSYEDIRLLAATMGIHAVDDRLFSETAYVRRLVEAVGLRATSGETPFKDWESLPDRALLAIKHHIEGGRAFWHWVVFEREGGRQTVLDSAAEFRGTKRTDLGSIAPKWFIGISGRPPTP